MSVKPAKDSTNQGWFVEYGAVAAPLPVCHPFMPASLSFLLPEDINIRSAKRSPHFVMGVNYFFTKRVSLGAQYVTPSLLDVSDLISLDIVTMVNVNSDKITEIDYKIDAF